jgi:hypothetical protein
VPEGKVYEIPKPGLKWFQDKLTKLGKRAEKLVGEKLTFMVVGYHREEDKNSKFYNEQIIEVFVAFPEPKLNGWTFAARIDHANEVGNIVRTVGDIELPEIYRHREPICDHCGYKRKRRDSFVVFHEETQEYKQVGTSCLKDFLGHGDAEKWAKVAEMIASIGEIHRTGCGIYSSELEDRRWFNVDDFCAAAAQAVLDYGWTSRKAAEQGGRTSTASRTWHYMHDAHAPQITEEARDLAEKALEAARAYRDKPDMNDYEHNCWVIASTDAMEARSAGIAASIVGVYYMKNQARKAAPKGPSSYQGMIGQKVEINAMLTGVFAGEFSTTHKFVDDAGNHYVWFASSENLGRYRGRRLRIKGTIKAHQEFRGVKQTQLSRCKLIEVFDEAGVPQSAKLTNVLV